MYKTFSMELKLPRFNRYCVHYARHNRARSLGRTFLSQIRVQTEQILVTCVFSDNLGRVNDPSVNG